MASHEEAAQLLDEVDRASTEMVDGLWVGGTLSRSRGF